MSKLIVVITLTIIISSCGMFTPQKRLNRIIKRNPYLSENVKVTFYDTIRDTITVFIKEKIADSTIHKKELEDTATVSENGVVIQVWNIPKTDSIGIKGVVLKDTVYVPYEKIVKVETEVEKIIYRKSRDALRIYVIIGALLLTLIMTLIYIIGRNKN